jgi:Ni2+-binding GTPase involved in maturation of urease and hydrogenase
MNLHLVGGFLGSGKTTAIISAARTLVTAGKKVGIITNDQGKFLVDSAFIRSQHLPVTEVSGGCFCCNFDDFAAHIDQMIDSVQPDVLFAESVGSCADLVATVIKPLLQFHSSQTTPTSFSVFTDSRLLDLDLQGKELPFSDEVTYIFHQQIEEAGLLVINKANLLSPERQKILKTLAQNKYSLKQVILQNSQEITQVKKWLMCIENGRAGLPDKSLNLDYQRYGAGETRLAWLDAVLKLNTSNPRNLMIITNIMKEIIPSVQKTVKSIGHIKFEICGQGTQEIKLSYTTLDDQDQFIQSVDKRLQKKLDRPYELIINVRVEGNASELKTLVQDIIEKEVLNGGGNIEALNINGFHPKKPAPTHHIK